jgi:glycosyltransferase involved in cell wall biosynthesis
MGAADVLVALLDPDASTFSVPSKVLAYHCAGRALLLAVPSANQASRIVTNSQSGIVVEPMDEDGFVAAAETLRTSPELRERCGRNALAYARKTFDLDRITDRFESLFRSVLSTDIVEALEGGEVASERA